MGNIAPTYHDRVRYKLQHNDYGSLVITEPIGWREDEKEYARNKEHHGVFAKFSNSLKFIDDGATYIQNVYNIYGINAEIKLVRDERHPHTDVWTRSYDGFLDLSTYQVEKGEISVKFNSGGLEQLLKTRQSEKVEIERATTMDGDYMMALDTKKVALDGRRIFLRTKLEITENSTNREANASIESNAGNTRHQTVGIPLTANPNSHQDIVRTVTPGINGTESTGDLGMMFMFDLSRSRVFDFKLNLSFNAFVQQYEYVNWGLYHVCLTIYKNGFDFDLKERIALYELEDNHPWFGADRDSTMTPFTWPIQASYQNTSFTLLPGESVALECFLKADFHTDNNAGIRVFAQNILADFTIEENSNFPSTRSKMILAHELGDRLTKIITNKPNAFYSEVLGRTDIGYQQNGDAGWTGFAHGMWIRGFDKLPIPQEGPPKIENKYKAFSTSFKDYMQSLTAIWNLGMGIERVGYNERIRIEPLSYFYNRNVMIKLPNQVKKVKRSIAKEHYCSSVEIGYEKGGEYEEAMGLDEYNARSNFITVINKLKQAFTAVSKYRADMYGMEFARRKQKQNFPSEDTSYDQDIWALDLKLMFGDNYKLRPWQDDFSQEPTGVYSPETATNLRFSPVNMLFRHGWVIAAGLTKYATDYVRYGSSTANSNLKTKLDGRPAYAENDDIINSELPKPRFVPEWIEFEHLLDFELNQKLEGITIVDGKEIQNFYGQIEFINENGDLERGYLFSVKPNDGKWKLLKAFR